MWLRGLGYTGISLDRFVSAAGDQERKRELPRRSLIITFDDGYRDNHDYAWPILEEFGFSATIFLVSGAIGSDNEFDRGFTPERVSMLSAEQIQAMHRRGVGFGSHTRTHPHNLADLTTEAAADEIGRSRQDIEAIVQSPVYHFSYPYARTAAHLEEQVRIAGYRSACVGVGTRFTQFGLSRISTTQRGGLLLNAAIGVRRAKHLARSAAPTRLTPFPTPRDLIS